MAWVVYSTELGYSFDGWEYWDSFEKATPGWTIGDRHFLRECFSRFVEKFNGYEPQGAWARQFSIIAYPITHSVIPQDLQQEFAKVLYDLRYYLTGSVQGREQLGNRIASVSSDGSNRFQQLAQNTDLMGLIGTQLLAQADSIDEELLEAGTLARIVKDVRRHRDAARWLDEARTHARNNNSGEGAVRTDAVRRSVVEVPMLYLQRSKADYWDLWVEIPNLSSLWDVEPDVFRFLQNNRIQIAGSFLSEKLPPGAISSYGPTRKKLVSLPNADFGLLKASGDVPSRISEFFKAFVPSVSKLVFKVREDGRALGIGSAQVRSGERFLVFAEASPPVAGAREVGTDTRGVRLFEFSIPETVDSQAAAFLTEFELHSGGDDSVRIQGLGSVPYYSEPDAIAFFEGDIPLIGLESPISRRVQLIDDDESVVLSLVPGRKEFISFESASVGSRSFRVLALDDGGVELERQTLITLPRGGRSNRSNRSPFALFVTPFTPSLEDVIAGRVQFELIAPEENELEVLLSIPADSDSGAIETRLLNCRTPVHGLGAAIAAKLRQLDRRTSERFDDTFKCSLYFRTEGLGEVQVNCSRNSLPVRWKVVTQSTDRLLKLVNYSDSEDKPKVQKHTFLNPDIPVQMPEFELHPEKTLNEDTGLFVATGKEGRSGIIILPCSNPSRVIRTFSEMAEDESAEVILKQWQNRQSDFVQLLDLYHLWATSPHAGNLLCLPRIKAVKEALARELVSCAGGTPQWRRTESQYALGRATKRTLLEAVTMRAALQAELKSLSERRIAEGQELVPLLTDALAADISDHKTRTGRVGSIQVVKRVPRAWFVEFALRLTSFPETIPKWAEQRLKLGIELMFEKPLLPRAARYLFLLQRDNEVDWRWDA